MLSQWNSYVDTLLNSKIQILTYAGLLDNNVTLFQQIATKLLLIVFCEM